MTDMPSDRRDAAHEAIQRDLEQLQQEQAARAMPLIGPLLDAYTGLANDVKGGLEEDAPKLVRYLDELLTAVEGNHG